MEVMGKKFGRLTVLEEAPKKNFRRFLFCLCSCGNKKEINRDNLVQGKVNSCGCLKVDEIRKRLTTHGMNQSPTHRTWRAMKSRCNPKTVIKSFQRNYTKKGITVCNRWLKFQNFYQDIGPKPSSKHSIDRIDGNKGYSPDNCRWATPKEQARNTSRNRMITYKGETKAMASWAEELGLSYSMVRDRIKRKWSYKRALETPRKE